MYYLLQRYQIEKKSTKFKKIIIGIFSKDNLKITFDLISTSVNFLNVNSDLKNITFQPYKKPNNDLLYLKIFPLEFRTCCVIFQKMRIYLIIIKRYIKRLWITVDMTMNWNLNHQTKEKEQELEKFCRSYLSYWTYNGCALLTKSI